VVASADLVAEIEQRVFAAWSALGESGKLTREKRAEILGVSARTADKLLARSRVDRASLTIVLGNLGIEWTDDLIEETSDAPDLESPAALVVESDSTSSVLKPKRRWWVPAIVLLPLGVLGLAVMIVRSTRAGNSGTTQRWPEQALNAIHRGTASYYKGDFEAADIDFSFSEKLARKHDDIGAMAEAVRMKGDVAAARGDLDRAEACYREALRMRQLMNAKLNIPPLKQAMGVLATRQRKFDSAKQYLLEALAGFLEFRDLKGVALAQRDLGALCAAQGQHRDALAWYMTSRSGLIGGYEPDIYADLNGLQAMSLLALGRLGEAKSLLVECMAHWKKKGHPRWIASTALKIGQVELALGNSGLARDSFLQSEKGYAAVGDEAGRRAAQAQLAALQRRAR
jgi:tetratricopeptide (TPR) repeat protein